MPAKTLTPSMITTLRDAARGMRLLAREAAPLQRRGLVVREPRSGWCIVTDAGREALESA